MDENMMSERSPIQFCSYEMSRVSEPRERKGRFIDAGVEESGEWRMTANVYQVFIFG
jgi:hypothetical protein